MLTKQDELLLNSKGITLSDFEKQLADFRNGFPFLKIESAATVGNGVVRLKENEVKQFTTAWDSYKAEKHKVVKFVPASGAASRMFKDLFAFLEAAYDAPTTDFEKFFFDNLKHFAFYNELNEKCRATHRKDIAQLVEAGNHKAIVATLLHTDGLNYGQLPKGLLLFHKYAEGERTAMEEHLVEAAQYAACGTEAHVHFTVSHEHLELFKAKAAQKQPMYEENHRTHFSITFSEQKPSTDTVAANPDNTPFRNDDGSLLFRPGGHGALIQNLNDIDADVVFIKNIDNVTPDRLKPETVTWKKVIAGVLVTLQEKTFEYVRKLKAADYTPADLQCMKNFLESDLHCRRKDIDQLNNDELAAYLLEKFNRPMRVCGMVRNSGEPGGGPFYAYNADNTVSLQILESSQIDSNDAESVRMFKEGTHFNPVDLVCATKDYAGKPFDLPKFVDPATGFITSKSKNGKELKALELPGLWNGAMSNWNTVFVEVPAITFNPVKTVNDLLREQHQ